MTFNLGSNSGTPPNLTQIMNVLQNIVVALNAQVPSKGTFVPYVGATTNINLGLFSLSAANITASGTLGVTGATTLAALTAAAITATSINFGGTALSHYVEGTWTPAITTDATAGTPAYSVQAGSYTRIGRVVVAQFSITLSGWTGSPTGNVIVSGLPLAATSTANDNASCNISKYSVTGLASSNYGVSGVIIPSATQILLYSQGNTGTSQITAAQAGTTATFIGSCVYHV